MKFPSAGGDGNARSHAAKTDMADQCVRVYLPG